MTIKKHCCLGAGPVYVLGSVCPTYLDEEVSQVQFTEDLMDNPQALCVGYHGVVLACYVKVLWRDVQNIHLRFFRLMYFCFSPKTTWDQSSVQTQHVPHIHHFLIVNIW